MRRTAWAVLVCVLCAGCGGGGPAAGSASPSSLEASTTAPVADPGTVVPVGKGPVGLAVDQGGAVWVAQAGDSKVSRTRDGKVDLDVAGLEVPLRLAAGSGAVWATAFGTGELARIDPGRGTVTGRVAVGQGAEGVAVGLGSVWVVAQDAGRVVRVDPAGTTVSGGATIPVGARLVTTGAGAVWVSHYRDGTILKVDPASLAVTTSPRACGGPQGIVATDAGVWVACTSDNTVVKLDPASLAVTARVPVAGAPDGLALTPDGRIAVVAQEGPVMVVVDPATATVVSRRILGQLPQLYDQANLAVVATPDAVWVSSFSDNTVRRLSP